MGRSAVRENVEERCCGIYRLSLRVIAAAGALALVGTAQGGTISGDALARRLASPHALFLNRAIVTGPLNLQRIGVVRAAFECISCTFTGGINARHVVFEREINLIGVRVLGPLDFNSASFAGALILRGGVRRTQVHGPVDFRLATFAEVTDAEEVVFQQDADFALARFRAEAIFSRADFRRSASFAGVFFDGRARFEDGSFGRDADFTRAVFGSTADFRSRVFSQGCQFPNANFRGLSDFGQATFNGVAEFQDARFEQDATFRGATFASVADPGDDRALSIGYVVSREKLDFGSATFRKFVLAENVVARTLNFDDVTFAGPAKITLATLKVDDLHYPLPEVGRIVDDAQQRDVLGQIEASAKNRGHIALANDARYRLMELAAHDYGRVLQALDAVFYRQIAGYFVRPEQPLTVFALLALALSLLRWFSRAGCSTAVSLAHAWTWLVRLVPASMRNGTSRLSNAWLWLLGLATSFFDTFGRALRHKGSDEQAELRGIGRRIEILTYRLLVVCALLGLANSNPTLRQMFDALV